MRDGSSQGQEREKRERVTSYHGVENIGDRQGVPGAHKRGVGEEDGDHGNDEHVGEPAREILNPLCVGIQLAGQTGLRGEAKRKGRGWQNVKVGNQPISNPISPNFPSASFDFPQYFQEKMLHSEEKSQVQTD